MNRPNAMNESSLITNKAFNESKKEGKEVKPNSKNKTKTKTFHNALKGLKRIIWFGFGLFGDGLGIRFVKGSS